MVRLVLLRASTSEWRLSRLKSLNWPPHDLLIIGASCRAAAFSALRCGFRPRCADYFADRDLAAVCEAERVDPRRAGRAFIALAESLPPSPWFYTGGFENHPGWVEQIARRHRLWGVDAQSLRAVRDPFQVSDVLGRAGIPSPAVRRDSQRLARDGGWLKKPLRSGGGRAIEPLTARNVRDDGLFYFQERIRGPSHSALFIGERFAARLIGVTRQLIGMPGAPFAYKGSIGPSAISEGLGSKLRVLGDALASAFGLAGWFGVDYILRGGQPWPVEVNPRYPASLEIHELAWRRGLLADHRRACEAGTSAGARQGRTASSPPRVVAKLILYATRSLIAPELRADEDESDELFAVRPIADIPAPGTSFDPGDPVMTILASGANRVECRSRLSELEARWRCRLGMAGGAGTSGSA
jgi:predicted ATP-grasp superfamily ATP-dependent carboligase